METTSNIANVADVTVKRRDYHQSRISEFLQTLAQNIAAKTGNKVETLKLSDLPSVVCLTMLDGDLETGETKLVEIEEPVSDMIYLQSGYFSAALENFMIKQGSEKNNIMRLDAQDQYLPAWFLLKSFLLANHKESSIFPCITTMLGIANFFCIDLPLPSKFTIWHNHSVTYMWWEKHPKDVAHWIDVMEYGKGVPSMLTWIVPLFTEYLQEQALEADHSVFSERNTLLCVMIGIYIFQTRKAKSDYSSLRDLCCVNYKLTEDSLVQVLKELCKYADSATPLDVKKSHIGTPAHVLEIETLLRKFQSPSLMAVQGLEALSKARLCAEHMEYLLEKRAWTNARSCPMGSPAIYYFLNKQEEEELFQSTREKRQELKRLKVDPDFFTPTQMTNYTLQELEDMYRDRH